MRYKIRKQWVVHHTSRPGDDEHLWGVFGTQGEALGRVSSAIAYLSRRARASP